MPTLKNERYENFARELVKAIALDRSEADSYVAAGFKAKNPNSAAAAASRLLARHPEIHARCAELQARAARRTNVTIESLVLEAEKARALAMEIRQPASAVSASSLKAKLTGNLVSRTEVGEPGDFARAETWADIVDSFLQEINPVPTAQIPQATRDAILSLFQEFCLQLDRLISGDRRRTRRLAPLLRKPNGADLNSDPDLPT